MKLDISLCTFRRAFVAQTLRSIDALRRPEGVEIRVIVVDNDDTPSAQGLVEQTAAAMQLPVHYVHAHGANISIARNAGLDAAEGDWIAFLDDDEVADPGWLVALFARQRDTGADGVFGHSQATYGPDAPEWIVKGNFHSQFVAPRASVVETGHTCNALLRWGNAPWRRERFEVGRGKAGGEDTEFFFRLRRMGARYAIADNAIVREDVPPSRLGLKWLLRRRFRIGQSYASSATTGFGRVQLFGLAAVKSGYSFLRAGLVFGKPEQRAFWLMRGMMHAGVCSGCLRLRQADLYGKKG